MKTLLMGLTFSLRPKNKHAKRNQADSSLGHLPPLIPRVGPSPAGRCQAGFGQSPSSIMMDNRCESVPE
jgi:hypothetical protein